MTEQIQLPYRSRFGTTGFNFTDSKSFRANNCVATASTNGVALSENSASNSLPQRHPPGGPFAPLTISPETAKKHPVSVLMNTELQTDIVLPPALTPTGPISGTGVAEFFLLPDKKTGVLALGSFDEPDFDTFETTLLTGLQALVSQGATQLVVDVVRTVFYSPFSCILTNSYRQTMAEVLFSFGYMEGRMLRNHPSGHIRLHLYSPCKYELSAGAVLSLCQIRVVVA